MKKKLAKINELLLKKYGVPPRKKELPDPLDILVGTILSQNTNDKNSWKAYGNLKAKYPEWEPVAALPPSRIEPVIKVAGLGKQKSSAISSALRYLKKKKGGLSLSYIDEMDDSEALEELSSFKGVGLKTASCVLLFSLDRNVCPVDTHVHRVLNRIGVVDTKSPDKTFEAINKYMPEGAAHQIHTNLIRLGRELCKPESPQCSRCPLLKACEFDNKNMQQSGEIKENDFFLLDSI